MCLRAAPVRGYGFLVALMMLTACGAESEAPKDRSDMTDLGAMRDMGGVDLGPEEMTPTPDMKDVDMDPGQLSVEGDGLLLKVRALGGVQTQTLALVNETREAVILGSVTLDERAEDNIAELSLEAQAPQTLAPGARAEVTVSYRPLNGVDDSAQLSFLVTAGGKMNIVSAFIFAKFEPGAELNYPDEVSFGAVTGGESKRMIFAIYNNTDAQVRLRDMYLAPLPSPFSFKIADADALEDATKDSAYMAEQPIEPKQPLWLSVTYAAADDMPQQADLVFVSTLGTRQVRLITP